MRQCDGFGRAGALLGAFFLASTLSACFGSTPQPQEYSLGAAGPGEAAPPAAVPPAKTGGGAALSGSADFAATAGDVVYFDGDSSELSPEAKAILRKQAHWLRQHPDYRILVEGHADEWGTRQHNLTLGAERAVAVKTYLENNGLRTAAIPTVSYGKERLQADCSDLPCRAQNRRARTVVTPPPTLR